MLMSYLPSYSVEIFRCQSFVGIIHSDSIDENLMQRKHQTLKPELLIDENEMDFPTHKVRLPLKYEEF